MLNMPHLSGDGLKLWWVHHREDGAYLTWENIIERGRDRNILTWKKYITWEAWEIWEEIGDFNMRKIGKY